MALLAPVGRDVRFSPVLAWFLAALNLIVILGALVSLISAARRRNGRARAGDRSRAAAPPLPVRRPRPAPQRPVRPAPTPVPPSRTRNAIPQSVLAKLSDQDPFQRMSAVASLRGRVDAERLLVRALHDRYPMVRREVVRALRSTGTPFATETLIKVAAHDPSAEVREEAVAALGSLLREEKGGFGPG